MSAEPQQPGPPQPRRRRLRWIVVLIAFLPLVAWFSRFAYLRITRRPTPRPEYWAARLAELDLLPATIPPVPEDAGASLLQQWVNLFPTQTAPTEAVLNISYGSWDETRQDIATANTVFTSKGYEEFLIELRDKVQPGWTDEVIVAFGAWSPMFPHYRHWAYWAMAHSRWSREHLGDAPGAVDDWLIALGVGRQARRTLGTMSWVQESSVIREVAEEMMYASSELVPPIDTAGLAGRIDEILGPPLLAEHVMERERLTLQGRLEMFYVREGGDWMSVADATDPAWMGFGRAPSRAWNLCSPLFHDLPTARAAVDAYCDAASELTNIVNADLAGEEAEAGNPRARLTALSGFQDEDFRICALTLCLCYRARCDLEAGLTMLALCEYQRQHGQYPDRLDDLVPGFLPRIPLDYADRQPLRYSLKKDGTYLLYSIGCDGQDDGGRQVSGEYRWSQDAGNHDAVFSDIRRPEVPE